MGFLGFILLMGNENSAEARGNAKPATPLNKERNRAGKGLLKIQK